MDGTPERNRLLELTADLILREGVIDMSLSAIARKIGSNNRMLLYYFGSKQTLLDEATMRAADRFPRLRDLFDNLNAPGDMESRLVAAWEDLSAPENHPFLRLFFQQFGTAMRNPEGWEAFTERAAHEWVDRARAAFGEEGASDEDALMAATHLIALWRGLQFLLLTDVDAEQLRATHRAAVRQLLSAVTPA